MHEPKFEVPARRYSGESAVISLRLPKTMLADLDQLAVRSGRNRNELVTLALEYALKNVEITDK